LPEKWLGHRPQNRGMETTSIRDDGSWIRKKKLEEERKKQEEKKESKEK